MMTPGTPNTYALNGKGMKLKRRTLCADHKEEIMNLDADRKKKKNGKKGKEETRLPIKANEIYLGI